MNNLHSDLVSLVVVRLPPRDLCSLRVVERRLRDLVDSESFCRKYYLLHTPPETRVVPPDVVWRDAVRRLPLLHRVAPLLRSCVILWPSLVASQQLDIAHTIEIHELVTDDEEAHSVQIGPRRDDATKMWLERLVNGQTLQTVGEKPVSELASLLSSLFLDGGRSLGLVVPLESTGRRIDFLSIGDEDYHRLVPSE